MLTRNLGSKYLWVDSLCLFQDHHQNKAIQIQYMHITYGQARLTAIAAGGDDANAGLPGLDC
jgi:hypothetical protein